MNHTLVKCAKCERIVNPFESHQCLSKSDEVASLRALNAELREILQRSMGLIGRGTVEGAYKDMVGGEQYANRVWDAAKAALAKAGA